MVLDGLRARLERLLAEQSRRPDQRAYAAGLHDALVEMKLALQSLRDGVAATERELAVERQQLADTERRGRLAAEIGDRETVEIARVFTLKHRERAELLNRKLAVQRDELVIAERDYQDLAEKFRTARQGMPPASAPAGAGVEEDPDLLRTRLDRQAAEAAAQAQLELLKKKLGKQ